MYYMLTNRELTILPNILFEGTENAFLVASGNGPELDSGLSTHLSRPDRALSYATAASPATSAGSAPAACSP
jgi:hypothetical protein